ncbi:MAG: primosomal protein N' [Clostridia bacterium]|nr:primosomal protein N' [Clostridia bacterium]
MTNKGQLISTVAVEKLPYSSERLFDYIVPHHLENDIAVGMRVIVPFGGGNRGRIAYVIALRRECDVPDNFKYIKSIQDKEPVVSQELIDCAEFVSSHCFCSFYESIKAMLPAGISYNIKTCYSLIDFMPDADISPVCRDILTMLKNNKALLSLDDIQGAFDCDISKDIAYLIKIKAICEVDDASRKIKDATIKSIRLISDSTDGVKLTPKQQQVFDLLLACESASVKEICYYTGVTQAVCDSLVKKSLAEYFDEETFRIPDAGEEVVETNKNLVLNDEQSVAFNNLVGLYCDDKPHVSLLYGVTGSGKTSVFMKLIDRVNEDGRGIIVMVPEISLTPQMVSTFKGRYGENVAVFHSGLSMGERMDEWKRVKSGKARIAIGTRSAVFAPFDDIGLIIIDEEQEHTYKSERSPRFHARDVAKFRCSRHNSLLLLASATPSVESMYFAKTGRYSLNVLKNRFGDAVLPDVITADMNIELENGNRTAFSSPLLEGIEYNLENGKQSIILLNRRGHNTYVSCRHCGKIVNCPNCSVSMTYHSANNRLMCHYCGYSAKFEKKCPLCSSPDGLRLSGTGTQRAELDLADIFPEARILRLDADSTLKKNSHARLLSAFARGEYDILLGTQMVAKGLNFPNVTLVGVLSADNVLYGNDFRSYERAFSLITQVVGRSGRGNSRGIAIIQTKTPESPVIDLASRQDYDSFFETDIKMRRAMLYPPFSDLCFVVFTGENKKEVYSSAVSFSKELCEVASTDYPELPLRVLGPAPAVMPRINNKYRYKLILKFKSSSRFRQMMSGLLKKFDKDLSGRDISIYADINPENVI